MSFAQEELDECVEWVNLNLEDEDPIEKVEQLQDGTKLIRIVEHLSGKKAARYFPKGQTLFQIQQNITILLKLIESCYGRDVMFDVSELSRGNIQHFLSLVFFIAKKSNTRIEKKRKFAPGRMSVGLLFEKKFQKEQALKIKTRNNTLKLVEELNETSAISSNPSSNISSNTPLNTPSNTIKTQSNVNKLNIPPIQLSIEISQATCSLDRCDTMTKSGGRERSQKLKRDELPEIQESMDVQEIPLVRSLSAKTDLDDESTSKDEERVFIQDIEDKIVENNEKYNKDESECGFEADILGDTLSEGSTPLVEEYDQPTIEENKHEEVTKKEEKVSEKKEKIKEPITFKKLSEEKIKIPIVEEINIPFVREIKEEHSTQYLEEIKKEELIVEEPKEDFNQQLIIEKNWQQKDYNSKEVDEIQRMIIGYLSRKGSKPTMRLLTQRKNVVNELIKTEQIYVDRLKQFTSLYLKTALDLLPNDKILKKCKEDIAVMLGYNNMILNNLLDLQKQGFYYGQGIGSVFQKLSHFLKTYCSYVNNTDTINEHEEKLRKSNKQFEAAINEIRTANKMESFNSYVILPVQRIPRYRLLLQELIKTVPMHHAEYTQLNESLQRIMDVGVVVNENKRKMENQQLLGQLLAKFKYPQGINPIEPKVSTKFIKFGVLTLYDPEVKSKCRSVNVFLFNDNLVIAKMLTTGTLHKGKLVPESVESIVESKKTLTIELVIPIERFTVVDSADIDKCPAFAIILDSGNSLRLYCYNEEEKISWCVELDAQISQMHEQTLLTITRSNTDMSLICAKEKESFCGDCIKDIQWQGEVGDKDQYLILGDKYLALFDNVEDAYKRQSPTHVYLTKYISVMFEPPTSISIIDYGGNDKMKISLQINSMAAALLWVFYIRQSFIKQQERETKKEGLLNEEEISFQLNSHDIMYGLERNKYNKICADCGNTQLRYVDLDNGCFLCMGCGRTHNLFPKTLGICTINAVSEHPLKDLQKLIELGNAFGNMQRIGYCEDVNEEKRMINDKNQYAWKKYNIQGAAPKCLVTNLQKKTRTIKLDEPPKPPVEKESKKTSIHELSQSDSSDEEKKMKRKKLIEKKEKRGNGESKRKRSIF